MAPALGSTCGLLRIPPRLRSKLTNLCAAALNGRFLNGLGQYHAVRVPNGVRGLLALLADGFQSGYDAN
jgi:hypothetical protein